MSRPMAPMARGLLQPAHKAVWHRRWLPSADLRDVIEHFWFVRWKCDSRAPQTVHTLPHPSVHCVFEADEAATLVGVQQRRFSRTLAGQGQIFGIKFRPASFYVFCGLSQRELVDKHLMLTSIWPDCATRTASLALDEGNEERVMQWAERWLRERPRVDDPTWPQVRDWVERLRADSGITRIEQLCALTGQSPRQLQRMFLRYVGVPPKRILQRYRLHEALAQVNAQHAPDWAALAQSLGYTDQSHFIRDFRGSVGCAPAAYQRQLVEA